MGKKHSCDPTLLPQQDTEKSPRVIGPGTPKWRTPPQSDQTWLTEACSARETVHPGPTERLRKCMLGGSYPGISACVSSLQEGSKKQEFALTRVLSRSGVIL